MKDIDSCKGVSPRSRGFSMLRAHQAGHVSPRIREVVAGILSSLRLQGLCPGTAICLARDHSQTPVKRGSCVWRCASSQPGSWARSLWVLHCCPKLVIWCLHQTLPDARSHRLNFRSNQRTAIKGRVRMWQTEQPPPPGQGKGVPVLIKHHT